MSSKKNYKKKVYHENVFLRKKIGSFSINRVMVIKTLFASLL